MVIESKTQGTTREVMAIVAGLSIQDPRERPLEKRPQADQAHARFVDKTSDFLTLLNLWNYLREKEKELSGNQFRRLCKAEYLNFLRVREWFDVYRQLKRMAKPLGLVVGRREHEPARHPPLDPGRPAQPDRHQRHRKRQHQARQQSQTGRLHRRTPGAVHDLPRLGPRQEAAGRGHERRAGRDQPPVRAG